MTDSHPIERDAEFERIVEVTGAFDKRHDDPHKNYGIGSCRIFFTLKGPKGAVTFQIGTDWHLPAVQREKRDWQHDYDTRFDNIKPEGRDVGYHSPKPMYEEQNAIHAECPHVNGECFCDGSGLRADEWMPEFIEGGTGWLWPKLETEYRDLFAPTQPQDPT